MAAGVAAQSHLQAAFASAVRLAQARGALRGLVALDVRSVHVLAAQPAAVRDARVRGAHR
jgi:hypothetical protein